MAIRVLVVDDEEDFLEALVTRLELRGMDVRGVTSGDEALETLAGRSFDVVVLDIKMPGMDGIDVLRTIRREHAGTAVLVLTGHASQELREEGRGLGAFDYLIKPVKLETILERIAAAAGGDVNGGGA
jgi:DNA-binding response OmpR family regulator